MPRVPVGVAEEDVEVRGREEDEEDLVEETEAEVDVEGFDVVPEEEEDFVDETEVDEAGFEVLLELEVVLEVVVTVEPPSLYISIRFPAPQYSY